MDYTEQSSWLLFLRYLDALEANKALVADLGGTVKIRAMFSRFQKYLYKNAAKGPQT